MEDKFISVLEATKLLKVHPQTIRRMLYDGRVKGFQLSECGRWRISVASLQKLVNRFSNK